MDHYDAAPGQAAFDLADETLLDPRRAMEQAEAFADATERGKWPLRLLELADVVEGELVRRGAMSGSPRELAEAIVAQIAHYQGGRPFYLPVGTALKRALRDRRIYRDLRNGNYEEIAQREGVCVQQIYKIYGEMRALEKRRRQLPLL